MAQGSYKIYGLGKIRKSKNEKWLSKTLINYRKNNKIYSITKITRPKIQFFEKIFKKILKKCLQIKNRWYNVSTKKDKRDKTIT